MVAAQRWEYARIRVVYDVDKGWVVPSDPQPGVTPQDPMPFDQLLKYWGRGGWELVSMLPQKWNTPRSTDRYYTYEKHDVGGQPAAYQTVPAQLQYRTLEWEVTRYLCVFKRRLA